MIDHTRQYDEHNAPTACCFDCRKPYESDDWVDAMTDDSIWEVIRPSVYPTCGLLCAYCIAARIRHFYPATCVSIGIHQRDFDPRPKQT